MLRRYRHNSHLFHCYIGSHNRPQNDDYYTIQLWLPRRGNILSPQYHHTVRTTFLQLKSVPNSSFRLGFSVSCVIVGGQTLAAVKPGTLSLTGGIIIIAVLSLVPCFIGYNFIHRSEKYAWIPLIIVMLCLWGLGAHAGFDWTAQKAKEDTGRALSADILSFGGIILGSFTGVRALLVLYQ